MSKVNHSFSDKIDIIRGPILASTSRYRRKLMEDLGGQFDTANPEIDETPLKSEDSVTLVARLARQKALAIAKIHPHRVVIGSDQIAVFEQQILGKPGTHERAAEQLAAFSGNRVSFLTAVTVCAMGGRSQWHHIDTTQVQFRVLGDQEIARYILKDMPLDCAGGFKSEQLGISLFDTINTQDPSALVGLPMIFVCSALRHYGLELP